ncbi:MAG: hypothetical protein V7L14_07995 [Nostoc sp.]
MKKTAKELVMPGLGYAYALGVLALTTSCTVASNTSTQTQQSPSVTEE